MFDTNSIATRRAIFAAAGVFALALCYWLCWGRTPQIGRSEAAFQAVDALFTAITAKDAKRLGECEQRLHALEDAGKLSKSASEFLDGLIGQARAGKWRAAAERLFGFMKAQRRNDS